MKKRDPKKQAKLQKAALKRAQYTKARRRKPVVITAVPQRNTQSSNHLTDIE